LYQKSVKLHLKIITRFLSKSGVPRDLAIILPILAQKSDFKSDHSVL